MIELSNDAVTLACRPDGTGLILHDKRRGTRWALDERTRVYHGSDNQPKPIGQGSAKIAGSGILEQVFDIDGEAVTYRWTLLSDGAEVELSFAHEGANLRRIATPGAFVPENEAMKLAVPIMQGVLFDRIGDEPFEDMIGMGAHRSISMAMLGYLAERSGMLVTIEDPADWHAVIGQRETGPAYAYADMKSSLGAMRYPRRVRFTPTDNSVNAVCKRYRARVQERGGFKSWEEKIAERPAVDRLFGALMTFVGYNQTTLDYAAECRKLKAYGFDRAFLYPVRFNTYSQDFIMGGDPPIWLKDQELAAIKEIGYDIAPWTWVIEGLDDGSKRMHDMFNRNAKGDFVPNWRIDDYQWYICCTPSQIDFVREAYKGDMKEMTWTHYDVSATAHAAHGGECYALNHPHHPGKPLDRRGDTAFLKELLGPNVNGNRVISSEGFVDTFAASYDIGSTKHNAAWGGAACWTIPMTMLVFHDSVIHDAWELFNYNAHDFQPYTSRYGIWSNGFPRDKAAQDALFGSPPNVFPFGQTYKWIDIVARISGRIETRFEDAAVQEALACALPVTKLHRKIGKMELLSHEFLSEDGGVQQTVFTDGTSVVANFTDEVREVDGEGAIAAKSWCAR